MSSSELDTFLRWALEEDLGPRGDITSNAVISAGMRAAGRIVARQSGVVAGLDAAARTFELFDETTTVTLEATNGARVDAGETLAKVSGPARSVLAAERVALNVLSHMSGVATATRALVDRIEGTGATVVDTRKTVPGLRALQKAAVLAGGGHNHRMGLYDAVLIKDNHVAVAGSAAEAVRAARSAVAPGVLVEVEIEDLADLESVIEAGADVVMLDNMDVHAVRAAVEQAAGRCVLEASGGITLQNIREVAETGVDWISVGWITHSAPALDVALDFEVFG